MTAAAADWDGDTRTRWCGSDLQSAAEMAVTFPVLEKRDFDDDSVIWFGNDLVNPPLNLISNPLRHHGNKNYA